MSILLHHSDLTIMLLVMVLIMSARLMPAAEGPAAILQRAHAWDVERLTPKRIHQVREWIATQVDDGTWPDLDLTHGGQAAWQPLSYIGRLRWIAVASGRGGPLAEDAGATQALIRGLAAWQRTLPRSSNWWYNDIGAPQQAVNILASRPDLPPAALETLVAIVGPARIGRTGQNRVWLASINLMLNAYHNRPREIGQAARAITSTLSLTTGEGPQHDGSFHQHGAQFYSGGYGRAWVHDTGYWAALLHGTPWAYSTDQTRILEQTTLDGLGWMMRSGLVDPACMGREAARAGAHGMGHLALVGRSLAAHGGERAADWQRFAAVADGSEAFLHGGAKHFWRSDASFLHRTGFSVGILAATTRTLRSESINNEHLFNALFADGATWIRRSGDEFHRLAPIIDWSALPGTVYQGGEALHRRGMTIRAESTFGGGIGSGHHLVHGWDLVRGDTRAAQAWFGIEQGLVVLLSGIAHPNRSLAVTGPVMPASGPGLQQNGQAIDASMQMEAGQSIIHDDLAWLALDGTWTIERSEREGSWHRINPGMHPHEQPLTGEVLAMRSHLGRAPSDAKVAWAVLEVDDERPPKPRFTVLANTPQIQAVRDADGTLMAVFREAGEIGGIVVDGPAIVLHNAERTLIADPTRPGGDRRLTVTVNGTVHAIDLPDGAIAGSPLTLGTE